MQSLRSRKVDDAHAVIATIPKTTHTSHGAIEYATAGAGPVVLALHGGMGGYDQGLILARSALADTGRYQVISVSRPGYLGTPLSSGKSSEGQADLYAELLDGLNIARTMVIAVSAGGPSALQFALRHPQKCAGVILVSACTGCFSIPPEVSRRIPVLKFMARFPWITKFMRRQADRNPIRAARRSIRDEAVMMRTLGHTEAGPLMRALLSSAMDKPAARLPGTLNDMDYFEVMAPIPVAQIKVPILVVHGEDDRVVPFEHGRRLADGAPNAELWAIRHGEHVSLFTHLDEIRAKVHAFTARCFT